MSITFPEGFVWGVAGAAHQIEGGNWNNDWWAWEHAPNTPCVGVSGDCCDSLNRYADDIAMVRVSASAPTGSRSSGRASNPKTASSPAPRSTTTGGGSRPAP